MDIRGRLEPGVCEPDLHDLLFGDVLGATGSACAWAWLITLLTAAFLAVGYKLMVFYVFDEEGAFAFGVPVSIVHYVFLMLMALAIVTAMRLVGVVLVTALLVIPGVIGRLLADRLSLVLLVSVLSGECGVLLGLLLAVGLKGFSSGPVIVLVLAVMLVLAACYRRVTAKRTAKTAQLFSTVRS